MTYYIAEKVGLSVGFAILSVFFFAIFAFRICDTSERDKSELYSDTARGVNIALAIITVMAGIGMAVAVFFITKAPNWGFVIGPLIIAVIMTIWFCFNGSNVWDILILAVTMGLIFVFLHDSMTALNLSVGWRCLNVCLLIATIASGIASVMIGYGSYLKREKQEQHGNGYIAGGLTVILFALVAIILLCVFTPKLSGEAQKISGVTISPEDAYDNMINDLTVQKVTAEDLDRLDQEKFSGISWEMLQSSLSPYDQERVSRAGFSDALTMPFGKATLREIEEEILRNPVYGVTVARAIEDKKIGRKAIKDFNSWLKEMTARNRKVFDWIVEKDGTFYVSEEYRCYAATLCNFLERLLDQGVQTRPTIENWCLNAAARNSDREGIKADYQYEKEALVLAYVSKDGAYQFIIGFNIHDKRPEFYGEKQSPKIVNKPTPSPSPSPTPTTTPKPTTTPTQAPTVAPTQKPTYNKDPNKATYNNLEPNDDPGPGPDTNNGKGATTSKADRDSNSNHYNSYEEYEKEIQNKKDINNNQKKDSNPSKTPDSGTKVDNNGKNGTGNGGIDTPTPIQEPAENLKNNEDNPAGVWGGP